MNTDTGQIYTDPEEIRAAMKRGEPLEPIGPGAAQQDKAEARRGYAPCRRERRRMARQNKLNSYGLPKGEGRGQR